MHRRHGAAENLPRLAGWWGHDRERRFLMEPKFTPLSGAEGWQLSNPPILSLAPLAASLALFDEAGVKRLRRKSLALTRYLEWLLERELGGRARLLTPTRSRPARLSSRRAVRAAAGATRCRSSPACAPPASSPIGGEPNVLRLAPVPLYNRYRDVYGAVQALRRTLDA